MSADTDHLDTCLTWSSRIDERNPGEGIEVDKDQGETVQIESCIVQGGRVAARGIMESPVAVFLIDRTNAYETLVIWFYGYLRERRCENKRSDQTKACRTETKRGPKHS
jgi:hypothetical protein